MIADLVEAARSLRSGPLPHASHSGIVLVQKVLVQRDLLTSLQPVTGVLLQSMIEPDLSAMETTIGSAAE